MPAFTILFTTIVGQVHGAINVGKVVEARLFVLNGAGGVFIFDPPLAAFKIWSKAGFISQRPDDDSGMVEITLYIPLVALQVRFGEQGIFRQRFFAIAHSMRFQIRFGYHVNAVFITEVVPQIIIGIVTGTHGIDIIFFHDPDVLQHALGR